MKARQAKFCPEPSTAQTQLVPQVYLFGSGSVLPVLPTILMAVVGENISLDHLLGTKKYFKFSCLIAPSGGNNKGYFIFGKTFLYLDESFYLVNYASFEFNI